MSTGTNQEKRRAKDASAKVKVEVFTLEAEVEALKGVLQVLKASKADKEGSGGGGSGGSAGQSESWPREFFIGGLLFGASLAVDLLKAPILAATISLCLSLYFLLGSVMFVVDSWGHVVHDHFHSRASNAYFLGSFFFWLGSAFFVLGSCFRIIIIYQSLTDLLAPSMNAVGSFFFIVGSVFYLVLGYEGITSFRNDQELPTL